MPQIQVGDVVHLPFGCFFVEKAINAASVTIKVPWQIWAMRLWDWLYSGSLGSGLWVTFPSWGLLTGHSPSHDTAC